MPRTQMIDIDAAFQRYQRRLIALARSRLSAKLARRVDAEDIVQSAYRSFFVRAQRGEIVAGANDDFWPLLATITLRKLWRTAKHHRAARRSIDLETCNGVDNLEMISLWVDREPSAADAVAVAEETLWLMGQLETLQREALQLRLQEFTHEEIAAKLNRSERTIRRWLVEARQLLIERWQQHSGAAFDSSFPQQASPGKSGQSTRDSKASLWLDQYRLQSLIGSGGMGKVYRAVEKSTGRQVAIKVLRKRLRRRPHLISQFLQEAEIVSQLDDPRIVRVYGWGELADGGYFMAMEFIDGTDLHTHCRTAELSALQAAAIVAEVSAAIEHAHQRGVIHCDLKPGNVLINSCGQVFVTDFGLACFLEKGHESGPAIAGTPGFMAPEQLDLECGEIGIHTDVYGLGALLYMLLEGRPPDRDHEIVSAAHCGHASQRQAPPRLTAIYRQCLARKPSRRFASAASVADALRAWVGTQSRAQ